MIAQAMQEMVDRLAAGGVRAGLHAADLAPPAVLVLPPTVRYTYLGGTTAAADWSLLAAVPDAGVTSLQGLSDLVEATRAALDWEVTVATAAAVTLAEGAPVPAYRLDFTTDIGG